MNLTDKQKETLLAMVNTMEVNFSFDVPFEEVCEDDFFNWANEEDIRGNLQGKTVSGRMSSLMKKGVFETQSVYETKWVKVRKTLVLKEVEYPLWTFTSKEMFGKVFDIQPGETINSALERMKETL